MSRSLNLFVPTPNAVAEVGINRDLLIPNPRQSSDPIRQKMFFYVGVILSVCYISRLHFSFRFARVVWAALAGTDPTLEDVFEIDSEFKKLVLAIRATEGKTAAEASWESLDYMFETKDSLGRPVELIPDGSRVPVTFERRMEFVSLAEKYRVRELAWPLAELRKGFYKFFAKNAAELFAPWEIEQACCGIGDCPVAEMKKHIVVESGDAARLWRILEQLSADERKLFIAFGTGRSGLPPPGREWRSKLRVRFVSSSGPDRMKQLPRGRTFESEIVIPRYESDEVFLQKLRFALRNSQTIEDGALEVHNVAAFL
jgi:hypothetical protein